MDIVQFYISSDINKYEVKELRIFDHKKRTTINYEDYIGVGYSAQNSIATVYSIGRLLPDEVDVWLRVIHKPNDPIIAQTAFFRRAFDRFHYFVLRMRFIGGIVAHAPSRKNTCNSFFRLETFLHTPHEICHIIVTEFMLES
jgi:hypothetical protein